MQDDIRKASTLATIETDEEDKATASLKIKGSANGILNLTQRIVTGVIDSLEENLGRRLASELCKAMIEDAVRKSKISNEFRRGGE